MFNWAKQQYALWLLARTC